MNNKGKPASPAPPKQPHSPAAPAQLSKHVVQSVHIQRVPGKWQSAHILHWRGEFFNQLIQHKSKDKEACAHSAFFFFLVVSYSFFNEATINVRIAKSPTIWETIKLFISSRRQLKWMWHITHITWTSLKLRKFKKGSIVKHWQINMETATFNRLSLFICWTHEHVLVHFQ